MSSLQSCRLSAAGDKEPLLESSSTESQPSEQRLAVLLKYGSLGFLIVQNSSQYAT